MLEEGGNKVDAFDYYQGFAEKVEGLKESLLAFLTELKKQKNRIVAYGAAAKGSTLINYVGLGKELLDFVVDRNPHKQGRYMPGKHLPIYSPERLLKDRPEYVLLLAWNFAPEIVAQQQSYLEGGGRFIVPVPSPRVIQPE